MTGNVFDTSLREEMRLGFARLNSKLTWMGVHLVIVMLVAMAAYACIWQLID